MTIITASEFVLRNDSVNSENRVVSSVSSDAASVVGRSITPIAASVILIKYDAIAYDITNNSIFTENVMVNVSVDTDGVPNIVDTVSDIMTALTDVSTEVVVSNGKILINLLNAGGNILQWSLDSTRLDSVYVPGVTATRTPTPTVTPTLTRSVTPTVTPSLSAPITRSVTPTATVTVTRTATVTPSATVTQTVTPTVTRTPSVTPSAV